MGNDTETKTGFIDAYSCTYPSIQAKACVISNQLETSLDVSWTRGSGANVLVVARESNPINPGPVDGETYSADAVFEAGSEIGNGNFVVYNGTGSSVTITGLNSGKQYYFAVYEYSSTDCYLLPSCTGSDETQSTGCTYCPSTYTDNEDDWITNVSLNTINNNSGQGGSSSYEDYTSLQTDLQIGSSYTVYVTLEMSGDWTEHVWVWIDWNQDCDFDDTDEAFDLGAIINDGTISTSITVPSNALLGVTTMRVIEQNNIDPGACDPHPNNYGETEDYSINIIAGNVGWLGNTTNWSDPTNWDGDPSVPSPSFDVTIPSSPAGGSYPIIKVDQNAACHKLTIEAGATVTVLGNLDVRK